jgi:uncharacterized 2Fe-2S/4Fe-4S cluster protein (DUF4445 family)
MGFLPIDMFSKTVQDFHENCFSTPRREKGESMSETQSYTIRVLRDNNEHSGAFGDSRNLLEYINTKTPFTLPAPCAGKGRCGKCRVRIAGDISPVTEEERRLIPARDLGQGIRLACAVQPRGAVTVTLEEKKTSAGNKSALFADLKKQDPPLGKELITLPEPGLQDQAADHSRLLRAPGNSALSLPLPVLRELPAALRDGNFQFTLCRLGTAAIAAEAGDTRGSLYGIAVDIGTTTVAAYLVDIAAGKNIGVLSDLNAQEVFGADVISRINYTMTESSGLALLHKKIIAQINEMIRGLAEQNGIDPRNVSILSLAGNTTMIHLALGISPRNIAAAPFIPVLTESRIIPARELGLAFAPGGLVQALPSISAYVGADIVAAILASGLDEAESLNLLIDIGTNGEIVLGNRDKLVTCSTAAGPAFEGAHIRNGAGGIPGAINSVSPRDGGFSYSTIADAPPLGICGSGIVDLLAFLLKTGIVDETGRLIDPGEADSPESPAYPFRGNLIEQDGEPAFLLVPEEDSAVGSALCMTQKDVREIQLAKAAIAAGIDTLIRRLEIRIEDIENLFLAGGFGSYIHKDSAVEIGLLPRELRDKIQVVGNAAGKGASMYLLSTEAVARCERIRGTAEYIELSSSPEFQDAYIEKMIFS